MEWNPDWSQQLDHLATVAIAAGIGAIVGIEREISDKPAGLRTHIFVAAGAALMMVLGEIIVEAFARDARGAINADPIRVMQSIVIGISFLGAGTIIHQGKERVEGLTTAASVFLTAGIGIAVAVDQIWLAFGVSLLGVFVLALMGWVERRARKRQA